MYAIVEISGKQFRAEKDTVLKVPTLHQDVGEKVEFSNILLTCDGTKTKIGSPTVKDAKIAAEVVEHGRDKKIVVFKKKRRKGYKVKRGHQQSFTKIKISGVTI
jgi:large subunit ribosomal protein L21